MEYLLDIVLTLLLSLAALVVAFPLAFLIFILVYGDKGREDPSQPPRSRWQLLKIFFCKALPRMFAVLVLRKPLTEEEKRYERLQATYRKAAQASEAPEMPEAPEPPETSEIPEIPDVPEAARPAPVPERQPEPERLTAEPSRPVRSGPSRYEQWLRQRRRRKDKTDA